MTVDETEENNRKEGLYFYLSVVADKACSKLVQTFAEDTVWKATPGFVRRVEARHAPSQRRGIRSSLMAESFDPRSEPRSAGPALRGRDRSTAQFLSAFASPSRRLFAAGSPLDEDVDDMEDDEEEQEEDFDFGDEMPLRERRSVAALRAGMSLQLSSQPRQQEPERASPASYSLHVGCYVFSSGLYQDGTTVEQHPGQRC